MRQLWGVDLGGTKLEAIVLEEGRVLARKRLETQAQLGYEHILKRVSELIGSVSAELRLKPHKIGFGTPGVLDPRSKVMKNCNTHCLNGAPLKDDLQRILGVETILANDANCFALAEAKQGAAIGAASVFGVILGTGVGGGVVIDGRVLPGAQGIAGEWGHNVFRPGGEACYCGKRGCVETELSGPALERRFAKLYGRAESLAQISAHAAEYPESSEAKFIQRLCSDFAEALAYVINILDPEVVVLGGGVSNIEALYQKVLPELGRFVFNNRVETRVLKNKLGDSAGVFGAAWLCAD